MKAIGGRWIEASVRGHLQQQGWGAQMGYPAIVLDEAGEEVHGWVFESENLAAHWDKLDEFEGHEYQRVMTNTQSKDGQVIPAYIYQLTGNTGKRSD